MLTQYDRFGMVSDTRMAKLLGLPEARISARRCNLMDRGLVRYVDDATNKYGKPICRWGLTKAGEAVARGGQ